MAMKWVALLLLLGGLSMLAAAALRIDRSSFDDGSFLTVVLLGIAGALGIMVGGVILLIDIFLVL